MLGIRLEHIQRDLDLCVRSIQHGEPGLGGGRLQPGPQDGQGGQGEAVLDGNGPADSLEVLNAFRQDCCSGAYFPHTPSLGFYCHR